MSWRPAAAWIIALVVTTGVTWQIVNFADSQVSARPVEVAAALTSTSLTESTSTTTDTTTASPSSLSTSSTSEAPTTPTTSGQAPSSPTTQPSGGPQGTTASTETSISWSLRTINSGGGTVIVRYRPGEVELKAATPLPGFDVAVDDAGPPEVRVEFDDGVSDYRIEARWKDEVLEVKVSGD